jgi:hypothetical protein
MYLDSLEESGATCGRGATCGCVDLNELLLLLLDVVIRRGCLRTALKGKITTVEN